MNRCEYDVNSFSQPKTKNIVYKEDNIIGFLEIGNKRKIQEDSLIISHHKDNKKIELLAIADGMGGLVNGDIASNFAKQILLD